MVSTRPCEPADFLHFGIAMEFEILVRRKHASLRYSHSDKQKDDTECQTINDSKPRIQSTIIRLEPLESHEICIVSLVEEANPLTPYFKSCMPIHVFITQRLLRYPPEHHLTHSEISYG